MPSELTQFEFNLLFILTIILLIIKFALILFISYKLYERKKDKGEFSYGFIFGVLILMITLFVSRILYMIFDFFYTRFDSSTYHLMPNIIFWKIATFINNFGYAYFIFIIDLKILKFKLRGSIAYIIIVITLVQLLYPVSTIQDFHIISTLDLFLNALAIIIPIFFFFMGHVSSPYQKPSLAIAFGVILYAIGSNINVEIFLTLLESVIGVEIRVIMIILSLIFKVLGLILFSSGVMNFAFRFSKEYPKKSKY
ncbi:MAG: hypothetical protein GF383_11000 [Candidatus Lokiarchaeota archaeon]|nr:hypothetical protein [Candidatus Lokiarchaeota archaeon]MBD3341141.1 hypothetical protein [Candidatus Lokiarchaeota archaeon]